MQSFIYSPVDSGNREIRLLRPILTRNQPPQNSVNKDPTASITAVPDLSLEFELEYARLDEGPVFTALSYCWGSQESPQVITVNGHPFAITKNLHSALRHFQYTDIAPAIWIDSICINQNDDDELSAQVKMMRAIYSGAAHVVIWLGDATDHSNFLAGAIRSFGDTAKREFQVPSPQNWPLLEYIEIETIEHFTNFLERCLKAPIVQNPTTHTIEAFVQIFIVFATCRPWWYRVWVIQEFTYAKKVFFQTGAKKISVDEFQTLLTMIVLFYKGERGLTRDRLRQSQLNSSDLVVEWDWPMYMLVQRERQQSSGRTGIYYVLCQVLCRGFHSTQNKDRQLGARRKQDYIYGLIGLFREDWEKSGLQVDYRKSWQAVYTEVAEYILRSGNLDFLSVCQHQDPLILPSLPSWSPIWHEHIYPPTVRFKIGIKPTVYLGNSLYSAATIKVAETSFRSMQTPNGECCRVMKAPGVLVDTILETKRVYVGTNSTSNWDRLKLYGGLFRDILDLCQQSAKLGYETYSALELAEARWRVPIRDVEFFPRDDDVGWRRATKLSKLRYQWYLPYHKMVEINMAYDDLQKSSNPASMLARALRRCRILSLYALNYNFLARLHFNFRFSFILHRLLGRFKSPYLRSIGIPTEPIVNWSNMDERNMDFNMYIGGMQTTPFRSFITRKGYIGVGPHTLLPNDQICILHGAHTPHVLRPRSGQRRGTVLIGDAYVHGIMDGEIMGENEEVKFEIY